MDQATFDFDTLQSGDASSDPPRRAAFSIGWDHARHGLVPPPEAMAAGHPVHQGWLAARAVFNRRSGSAAVPRALRQWLALRLHAWQQGQPFDSGSVTPQHLLQIEATHCPVLRQPLGGAAQEALAPVWLPLDAAAGFTAGHVVRVSLAVAQARERLGRGGVREALRRAHRLATAAAAEDGLDASAWQRLAVLLSFATPLPLHEAATLPLVLMPPPGVVPVNAVQRLQAQLTAMFCEPGWSTRARAVAARLPAHTLRTDFHLFIGALVPRLLEAGADADAATRRRALEDAWAQPRVQRRWQHLALQLSEAGCRFLAGSQPAPPIQDITKLPATEPALPGRWRTAPSGGGER